MKIGRAALIGSVDVFNILNRSDITTLSTSYTSTSWLQPTQILVPRYAKFSAQIDF